MTSYVLRGKEAVAYEDIPSGEELEAIEESSAYTNSLDENQKGDKIREVLKLGCLMIVGLLALGFILVYLDFVLVPLVFARFLLYIFQPFINLLVGKKALPFCKIRFKWPRWVAVIAALLLLVVAFVILGAIVAFTISDIIDNADYYVSQFDSMEEKIIEMAASLGYTKEDLEKMIPEIDVGKYAIMALQYLLNVIPQMVLVLLIMVYMLLGYDGSNKSQLRSMIDSQIRTYILIHTLISIATGIGSWLVLFIFSVDLAVFWGFMNFVLNYIPNIGSVLGVILPLPFVVLKEDFQWWELAAVAAGLTIVQFVLGQVLEPQLLGNKMEIPPITVIVALLFWGSVWGIIGAIISVPLTVAIRLYLENIDHPAPKVLAGMLVGDFGHFDTSKKPTKPADGNDEEMGNIGLTTKTSSSYDY